MSRKRPWIYALRVFFTPSCWMQNNHYSRAWDKHLRSLIADFRFEDCNGYTAKLGDANVWVSNHPYASFTPRSIPDCRPARATVLWARDVLLQDLLTGDDSAVAELERLYLREGRQ